MTTPTRTTLVWRCAVCRARGEVTLTAPDRIDRERVIALAHGAKQPGCDGTAEEVAHAER
jgi:hypothetical protein